MGYKQTCKQAITTVYKLSAGAMQHREDIKPKLGPIDDFLKEMIFLLGFLKR